MDVDIHRIDSETFKVDKLTNGPGEDENRTYHTATLIQDTLWIIGGMSRGKSLPLESVRCFDFKLRKWQTPKLRGPTVLLKRMAHCAVRDPCNRNVILLFGGFALDGRGNEEWLNDIVSLDTSTLDVRELHPAGRAPPTRAYHDMVTYGQLCILLYGRQNKNKLIGDLHHVDVYDSKENKWYDERNITILGSSPLPRAKLKATSTSKGIFVSGGALQNGRESKPFSHRISLNTNSAASDCQLDMYRLELSKKIGADQVPNIEVKWSPIDIFAVRGPQGTVCPYRKISHNQIHVNGHLFVFGGYHRDKCKNKEYDDKIWTIRTKQRTHFALITPPKHPRALNSDEDTRPLGKRSVAEIMDGVDSIGNKKSKLHGIVRPDIHIGRIENDRLRKHNQTSQFAKILLDDHEINADFKNLTSIFGYQHARLKNTLSEVDKLEAQNKELRDTLAYNMERANQASEEASKTKEEMKLMGENMQRQLESKEKNFQAELLYRTRMHGTTVDRLQKVINEKDSLISVLRAELKHEKQKRIDTEAALDKSKQQCFDEIKVNEKLRAQDKELQDITAKMGKRIQELENEMQKLQRHHSYKIEELQKSGLQVKDEAEMWKKSANEARGQIVKLEKERDYLASSLTTLEGRLRDSEKRSQELQLQLQIAKRHHRSESREIKTITQTLKRVNEIVKRLDENHSNFWLEQENSDLLDKQREIREEKSLGQLIQLNLHSQTG